MINSLNIFSAVCALAAAICWFLSAALRVPARETRKSNGWSEMLLESDGADVIESGKLQQKWSKRGAIAAGLAALFQASVSIATFAS